MSKSKIMLVAAACGLLSACSSTDELYNSMYSGPRYVPRPAAAPTETTKYEDRIDRMKYNRYEERESCQHYRAVPRNSVETGNCVAVKAAPAPAPVMAAAEPAPAPAPMAPAPAMLPIIHTYTVLFDLNKSMIRADQMNTLNQIAGEIQKYSPAQITVTGFADTSGKASYNQALSAKRAASVTTALKDRNIVSQEVDQKARGESDLAVPTPDNTKKQENRRVVVDFRK